MSNLDPTVRELLSAEQVPSANPPWCGGYCRAWGGA